MYVNICMYMYVNLQYAHRYICIHEYIYACGDTHSAPKDNEHRVAKIDEMPEVAGFFPQKSH